MPCNTQLCAVYSLLCGPSLSTEAYIEKDQRIAAPKYCPTTIYSDILNYDLSVHRLTPFSHYMSFSIVSRVQTDTGTPELPFGWLPDEDETGLETRIGTKAYVAMAGRCYQRVKFSYG